MQASYSDRTSAASTPATREGVTVTELRDALRLRYGDLIARMERRGMLCLEQTERRRVDAGKAVCVVADGVQRGQEVGAFLHACGEYASLQDMLGGAFDKLMQQSEALAAADDMAAIKAEVCIPDDVRPRDVDAWQLANTVEAAASEIDRPHANSAGALKLLNDATAAVRGWWANVPTAKILAQYGQGVQLSPRDVAALMMQAVDTLPRMAKESPRHQEQPAPAPDMAKARAIRADFRAGRVTKDEAIRALAELGLA